MQIAHDAADPSTAIKRDLSEPSKCSEATVQLVRELLGLADDQNASAVTTSPRFSRTNGTVQPKSRAKASKSTKSNERVRIVEQSYLLDRTERRRIATDIVNVSLSTLTTVISQNRVPQDGRGQAPITKLKPDTRRYDGAGAQRVVEVHRASLLERSPNRTTLPANNLKGCDPVKTATTSSGIEAVARCCQAAFSCLRAVTSTYDLQVEQGMTALIGRLVSLNYVDLATKELIALKARLQARCTNESDKPRRIIQASHRSTSITTKRQNETLLDLLQFEKPNDDPKIVALMIGHQMLVLRLMRLNHSPMSHEMILESLDLNNPSSPCNLIQTLATLTGDSEKVAVQLNMLANNISALCPVIPPRHGETEEASKSCQCSGVHVRLQTLSFCVRLLAMQRSHCNASTRDRIWRPFAKVLLRYSQNVTELSAVKYATASACFKALIDGYDNVSSTAASVSSLESSALNDIYILLSQLAETSDSLEDATMWIRKGLSYEENSSPKSERRGELLARLATLNFRAVEAGRAAEPQVNLKKACGIFSLRQSVEPKQDLTVMRVATLLQSSAARCFKKINTKTKLMDPAVSEPFSRECKHVLLAGLEWLTTIAKSTRTAQVFNHLGDSEMHDLSISAKLSVEYVVNDCSDLQEASINDEIWKAADANLTRCLQIMGVIDLEMTRRGNVAPTHNNGLGSWLAMISNAHYRLYLLCRHKMSDRAIRSLASSCDILQRAEWDLQVEGKLSLKLSRLAYIKQSTGEFASAARDWQQCVNAEIRKGTLTEALTGNGAVLWSSAWRSNTNLRLLEDSLRNFLELEARHQLHPEFEGSFLNISSRSGMELGLLVEQQLRIVSKWTESTTLTLYLQKKVPLWVSKALELYQQDGSDLPLLRLCLEFLRLALDAPNCVDRDLCGRICNVAETGLRMSNMQASHDGWAVVYLKTSLKMALALRSENHNVSNLEGEVDIWHRMLDKHTDQMVMELSNNELGSWRRLVEHLAAYCDLNGLYQPRLAALHLMTRLDRAFEHIDETPERVADLDLALQLLRLGYHKQAGSLLDRVSTSWSSSTTSGFGTPQYQLARAEHCLALADLEHCHDYLELVEKWLLKQSSEPAHTSQPHLRALEVSLRADYHNLASKLQYQKGHVIKASVQAKLELACLQPLWKALETRQQKTAKAAYPLQPERKTQDLSKTLASLTLTADDEVLHPSSNVSHLTPTLLQFPIVSRLSRSFKNLALIYFECGDYSDAIHYLTQAERLVSRAGARYLVAEVFARKGDYYVRAGQSVEGRTSFDKAGQLFNVLEPTAQIVQYHEAVGHLHHLQGQWPPELHEYQRAREIIDRLADPRHLASLTVDHNDTKSLSQATKQSSRVKVSRRGVHSVKIRQFDASTHSSAAVSHHNAQFSALRSGLACLIGASFLAQGDLVACKDVLSGTLDRGFSKLADSELRALRSRLLIAEGLTLMSQDVVLSMLPESTLSIPAVVSSPGRPPYEPAVPIARSKNRRKKNDDARAADPRETFATTSERVAEILWEAYGILASDHGVLSDHSSRAVDSRSLSSLGYLSVLLSYADRQRMLDGIHPLHVALYLNSPNMLSGLSERYMAFADHLLKVGSTSKYDGWHIAMQNGPCTAANLQKEFIELLPDSWTVVSMSLDTDAQHLLLTRYKAARLPFIVRLPLTRQNEGTEDDSFSFHDAKTELQDIISESDATVHSARDDLDQLTRPGGRTSWWAKRELLDSRLKELLFNIENMWVGGFRGLFAQQSHQAEFVARFQQSFENILAKHLPSRQRLSTQGGDQKIKLDRHVLELFVGLGEPTTHDFDFEEALTDLLYYVVDILQFSGEPNAYDEIDFDAVIVELHSALESYHEVAKNTVPETNYGHTVLVLDKEIHAFPWESLPCLDGHSVSRVHSLLDLHERLSIMKGRSSLLPTRSGVTVSASCGTYFLNPSGDLERTQSRFEQTLDKLSSTKKWTGFVNSAPIADAFESALSDESHKFAPNSASSNRVLLYFGHGSGFQYVKQRHVKALRYKDSGVSSSTGPSPSLATSTRTTESHSTSSPASSDKEQPLHITSRLEHDFKPNTMNPSVSVPLLFGCSSASLRLYGEFEPAGTPKAYMLAGAPALLGSLWDVTDGDIDKFAGGVLERWGLFERGAFEREETRIADTEKRKGHRRAKVKAKKTVASSTSETHPQMEEADWGRMSLTDACARSRKNCYLRYLNGAAMVVYGVPVYLDDPV